MDPVLIFLAIAMLIIAVAFFLARSFRKKFREEARREDLNASRRDGDAIATWSGIENDSDNN